MEPDSNITVITHHDKPLGGSKKRIITTILGIFILAGAVATGSYLVQQNQKTRTRAGGVILSLSSNNQSPQVGSTFTVALAIDTGGTGVSGADIKINYDPNALTATQIQAGTFLPTVLSNGQISSGSAKIILGTNVDSSGPHPATGVSTLAQVTFTVKAPGTTTISYDPATIVTTLGQTTNSVGTKNSLQITIPTPTPVPIPGLTGWWKFDETSGSAVDSSGNNLTGTPNGTTIVAGKSGNGRNFTPGNYINMGAGSSLNAWPSLTLSGWINIASLPANSNTYYLPFGKDSAYRFIIGPDGSMHFVVATTANGWYSAGTVANSDIKLATGTWYHIAGVYDGTNIKIYINGVLHGTSSPNISGNVSSVNSPFTVGIPTYNAGVTVNGFNGIIDNVRLYKAALNQSQISQDMNTF